MNVPVGLGRQTSADETVQQFSMSKLTALNEFALLFKRVNLIIFSDSMFVFFSNLFSVIVTGTHA